MRLSAAIAATVTVLRRKPSDLLPMYLLGVAVPALSQTVAIVGIAAGYAYLAATGRIARFRDAWAAEGRPQPDPEAGQEALGEWVADTLPLFEPLSPRPVILLLSLVAVIAILLALVAGAAVAAGQVAACYGRVRDLGGLTAGVAGVRRHWLAFLGLTLLELLLWVGLSALALAAIVVAVAAAPLLGVVVALATFPAWLAAVAAVRALFAFAPMAVVVDDAGVGGGLRGSWGFVRSNPVEALLYYAVSVGVLVAFGVVAAASAVVEVGSVVALVAAVAIAPALDLTKTALYAGHREVASPPRPAGAGLLGDVADGMYRGWRELIAFVWEAPGLHVVSVGLVAAGFASGWLAADPFAGIVEASIAGRLAGAVPPAAAVNLFGNNLTVAVSVAYAGVAFGLPSVVLLWFNGVVFGSFFRLEANPAELVAFVVPHGLLELPAIFVAGAVGLYLGLVGWRTWRGRRTRVDLADALERAFWVTVGVGVVLFVAALIEGFVSPYYYQLFL